MGRNAPRREQVVRRLTKALHSEQILETLNCELSLQVPLHRRCLPGCGPHTWATRDIQTTFVYRQTPFTAIPRSPCEELSLAPLPSGGGGSLFLSPSLSVPPLSALLRGPPFSQFSTDGVSDISTFGTQTLLAMRKFLDDVEMSSRQKACSSHQTKKESNDECAECAGEGVTGDTKDTLRGEEVAKEKAKDKEEAKQGMSTAELEENGYPSTIDPEVVRAFRMLFNGFEEQWCRTKQPENVSSDSEEDDTQDNVAAHATMDHPSQDEIVEEDVLVAEPQLYLCDDWISPMKVMRKPKSMTAKEKRKTEAATKYLILTMMSLELGFGSIIERYRQARDAVVERYQQKPENAVYLDSVILTDADLKVEESDQLNDSSPSAAVAAIMPPLTRLADSATRKLTGSSACSCAERFESQSISCYVSKADSSRRSRRMRLPVLM